MNTNHFDDARIPVPVDFGGNNARDQRPPQSRIPNRQSFSDHGFMKPRFQERQSPYSRIPISVNRAKLLIPYKSELCLLFQKGRCFYGENCHFAHKLSEIRKPGLKTADMEEHVMRRGRDCHYLSSGMDCPYGNDCNCLHKCNHVVRKDGAGFKEESDRGGNDWIDCSNLSGGQHYDKSIFHKTKLCARWEESTDSCPYGERCTYAHGIQELKEIGHIAELEKSRASRLMLYSQASNAEACKRGIKTAKNLPMEKVHFMGWPIAKISEVYADWIGDGHDFQVL